MDIDPCGARRFPARRRRRVDLPAPLAVFSGQPEYDSAQGLLPTSNEQSAATTWQLEVHIRQARGSISELVVQVLNVD